MTTRFLQLLVPAILFTATIQAQTTRVSNLHIGLIYPVSSNGSLAKEYTNHCSFHAIAGVSGNEEGGTFAGFANLICNNAKGGQFAGFSNHIGGSARGAQIAGFMNYIRHQATGVQAAGFANYTGNAHGAQLAGFANISVDSAEVQLSGFISTTKYTKVQVSGFISAAKEVKGIQLAGFVNVAKHVDGSQVAGFINAAKTVKGVQVGVINVADSSEYPIGLVNIVKNGEMSIGVSMDETVTGLLTFRSGGKHLYGILGIGLNMKHAAVLHALEGGLGLHVPLTKHLRVNMEGTVLALTDFEVGRYLRSSYRLLPAISVGQIELFAGPSVNCVTLSHTKGQNLVNSYAYERKRYQNFTGVYFGGMAGVQFRL